MTKMTFKEFVRAYLKEGAGFIGPKLNLKQLRHLWRHWKGARP